MKKILSVVGARPNFMKIAPIARAIKNFPNLSHYIVHTGQHYDAKMSDAFFEDLEIPNPDFFLGVGSGSHAEQTANIMLKFEKILIDLKPDLVLVVGDVNSTLACSITAVKMGIKVAHIESGLRSYDRDMPEEINRMVTDSISDYYFITEKSGYENLLTEGKNADSLFWIGNTMIDTLVFHLPKANTLKYNDIIKDNLIDKFKEIDTIKDFVLVTLHRPSNVDDKEQLSMLFSILNDYSTKYTFVLPLHPRTYKNLQNFGILEELNILSNPNIILIEPLSYLKFVNVMNNSLFVLTDSGGIQEETTYLKKLCITLRTTTERPITTEIGSNVLINPTKENIENILNSNISELKPNREIPVFWDGLASDRICTILDKILE